MQIQFAAQSYQSHSLPLDAQRCVNFYVEASPKDAKERVPIFGCPGLAAFATCGNGPVYDLRIIGTLLYATTGEGIYSVTSAGAATKLASFTPAGRVSVADNGIQIMVVDGVSGWCYNTVTQVLTKISSASFYPANTVTYVDDYFAFDRSGTNQFFISGLGDGTSYTGTDFASAEASPDNVLAVATLHDQLILFGGITTEVWYDSGALDFPFQPFPNTLIERGIMAPRAFVKEDNTLLFAGNDVTFYRLNQLSPARVSTHAVEKAWGGYSVTSDMFCFSYTHEGHKFVVVTFPTAGATWVLDLSTGLWHERESWQSDNTSYGQWRGNCAIRAYNEILVGDAFSGVIATADFNTYTELGNTMRGLVTAPPIHNDRKRIFMSRFELDVESGVGLSSGQGSDPQIMLDWSDDGARTWSALQKWRSMGKIGAYKQRLRWLRMGQSRQRVLRLQVTDPVRRNLIGTYVDLKQGMG